MTIRIVLVTAAFVLGAASAAPAADLAVSPRKSVRVIHHHALRAVRDYDGTPVVFRNHVQILALRAQPSRYLNGQPVAR